MGNAPCGYGVLDVRTAPNGGRQVEFRSAVPKKLSLPMVAKTLMPVGVSIGGWPLFAVPVLRPTRRGRIGVVAHGHAVEHDCRFEEAADGPVSGSVAGSIRRHNSLSAVCTEPLTDLTTSLACTWKPGNVTVELWRTWRSMQTASEPRFGADSAGAGRQIPLRAPTHRHADHSRASYRTISLTLHRRSARCRAQRCARPATGCKSMRCSGAWAGCLARSSASHEAFLKQSRQTPHRPRGDAGVAGSHGIRDGARVFA